MTTRRTFLATLFIAGLMSQLGIKRDAVADEKPKQEEHWVWVEVKYDPTTGTRYYAALEDSHPLRITSYQVTP